jgi:hypothetical protein
MKRIVVFLLSLAVVAGIFWFMVSELDREPAGRDEPPAVILRAPEAYAVKDIGAATFAAAAAALNSSSGDTVGVEFSDDGDAVILLADRVEQKITEMRAARTGTLVERTWSGDVDRRLRWAADNGNLDVAGLSPPTGKNLYH